jgi:hypothetical protein
MPQSRSGAPQPSAARPACHRLLALALLTALPATGMAADNPPLRLSAGGSYSTLGDPAGFIAVHKPFTTWRGFDVEAAAGLFGKHGNPDVAADRDNVGFIALGLAHHHQRWTFSFSVAASYPKTSALSSVGQFLSQVAYRIGDGYAIRLGHMSNASTHGRNHGETFLAMTVDL